MDNNLYLNNFASLRILDNESNSVPGMSKSITINIVNKDDIDDAFNVLFDGEGDINDVKLSDIKEALCMSPEKSAVDKIVKLWVALTSPMDLFGGECRKSMIPLIKNYSISEINDTYIVDSIELSQILAGTFEIIFLVNGIESNRTSSFTIIIKTNEESVFPWLLETIWSCGLLVVLILFNAIIFNKYTCIFSFLAIILELAIVQQSTKGILFQAISFIILLIMAFIIISTFILELIHGENEAFSIIRPKVFRAYSNQLLFGFAQQTEKKSSRITKIELSG